jgi:parallel beta-helix repeat protein
MSLFWLLIAHVAFSIGLIFAQTEQQSAKNQGVISFKNRMLKSPITRISSTSLRNDNRIIPAALLAGMRRLVPQEYTSIQSAIDASDHGDTVLVSDSTYYENINFKGKAIILASLYLIDGDTTHIYNTIIDGSQPSHADSGSVVSFVNGEDTTSVLCGMTIRGGSGTVFYRTNQDGEQVWFRAGGGIFCDSSGVQLVRNIITHNRIIAGITLGGGIGAIGTSSFTPYLVLDKNRITDNYLQGSDSEFWSWGGGAELWGVSARITGNLFARDSIISASGAASGGLDIGAFSDLPKVEIQNNIFSENFVYASQSGAIGGAMTLAWTDEVLIQANIFKRNKATTAGTNGWAQGGGLCITDQEISNYGIKKVLNNRFIGNRVYSESSAYNVNGGGILVYRTTAILSGNLVAENVATSKSGSSLPTGGGIAVYQSGFSMNNCIISENTTDYYGGGLDIFDSPLGTLALINNTFYSNASTVRGGGISVRSGAIVLYMNNIIWANSANSNPQIYRAVSGYFYHNNIQGGGFAGTRNIDSDPLFVDMADYHLSDSSPCIGAGIDTVQIAGNWYYAPIDDFDGNPRPNPGGSRPDIGAYENHRGLSDQYVLVPEHFPSIQTAIDSATDGDIVLVAEGTYPENINFKGKPITVASHYILDDDTSHIVKTVIDGSEPSHADSGSVVYFISGEDTTSILYGLTITGGSGTIIPPYFENSARGGGGILCVNSNARIEHNRIVKNSVDDQSSLEVWGGGIFSWSDSTKNNFIIVDDNKIIQNTLDADTVALGGGIYVGTGARITNNLVTENINTSRGGSLGGGISGIDLFENDNSVKIMRNLITHNQANSTHDFGGQGGGVSLWRLNVYMNNNTISINKTSGSDVSWASGLEIGFAAEGSIIEDNIISNNSSSGGDLSATCGFYASNGLTVQKNIIENNSAYWAGGVVLEGEGVITFTNNLVIGNSATYGGGVRILYSNPVVQNNLITNNTATYGGGFQIYNESAAGISKSSGEESEKQKLTSGGRLTNMSLKRFRKARQSQILTTYDTRPVIVNNTIVNNIASNSGGGIYYNSDSNPLIFNSILWGNEAPSGRQIFPSNGSIDVVYSDVEGSWGGVGNINADPLFADTEDFHLSESSPCIGVGIDTLESEGFWYYAPSSDYHGNDRPNPQGSLPDMGAYESDLDIPVSIAGELSENLPRIYALGRNFPNPFNPSTMINYQLPLISDVELSVYNLLGQKVVTLVSRRQEAGYHQVEWDASQYSSGIYYYRFTAGKFQDVKKMILVK